VSTERGELGALALFNETTGEYPDNPNMFLILYLNRYVTPGVVYTVMSVSSYSIVKPTTSTKVVPAP